MKTILAPTDYSAASRNAVLFALSLAGKTRSSLLLHNAYHIPVAVNEMPVMAFAPDELEKSNLRQLEEYKDQLAAGRPEDIPIRCLSTPGFAVDEITEVAEEEHADIIVMGIAEGAELGHLILGSVTTGVLKSCVKPLVIVPQTASFKGFNKIAFAYDGEQEIGPSVIRQLGEFIRIFGSELMIIIVENKPSDEEDKILKHKSSVENLFKGIRYTLHFSENTDVTAGITSFTLDHRIDLLVMVPRNHSFFERIFTRRNTSKMAENTHIPILALHEML